MTVLGGINGVLGFLMMAFKNEQFIEPSELNQRFAGVNMAEFAKLHPAMTGEMAAMNSPINGMLGYFD